MIWALTRLEFLRVAKPLLRSFVPLVLLAIIAVAVAVARDTSPDPQLFVLGTIMLSAMSIPGQVGRDRESGVLDYFATFPVSGYQLLAARVIALAIIVTGGFLVALMIGLVTEALPFATLSLSSQATLLIGSFMVVLSVGMILISLLTRYSLVAVLGVPIVGALILAQIGRFFSFSLDTYVSVAALTARPQVLITAGILTSGTLLCGVFVASALAARTLQPLPPPLVSIGDDVDQPTYLGSTGP